jgi:nucleoside phosphorylase
VRIACIAAVKMEVNWLLGQLSHPERREKDRVRLWVGGLGADEVAVFLCGMGPRRARESLEKFAVVYRADYNFHLGVCGALVEDLPRYCPVAALRVKATYERALQPIELTFPDSATPESSGFSCLVRKGHFLTHDQPVFSRRTRNYLHRKFSALCVDMEAWEVASYSRRMGIPLTVIKAVSDFADNESAENFVFHARLAAEAAGRVIYNLITRQVNW